MTKQDLAQLAEDDFASIESNGHNYDEGGGWRDHVITETYEAGARMMLKRIMDKCDNNWYAPTANDLRNMLHEEFKQLLP